MLASFRYDKAEKKMKVYLDAHPLQVIQRINQSSYITTMTHLVRSQVVLEESSIDVVVLGVTVDEAVQEKGIYRKPPVIRRREICVIRPVDPVICRVGRGLVLVEVVLEERLIVGPAHCYCCEQRKQRTWRPPPHVGGS